MGTPAPPVRGDRALVTGASSGLGSALARALAEHGWSLVLSGRRTDALDELASELGTRHRVGVEVVSGDLAEPGGADALADAVAQTSRPVALLVNNAGAGAFGPWLDQDAASDEALVRLNLLAPMRLTRRLTPPGPRSRPWAVLNVASIGAMLPGPRLSVYYAAKAALLSWSLALSEEWRGTPWSATCLCPGPLATDFARRAGFRGVAHDAKGASRLARVAHAGVQGTFAGRPLIVPGVPARLVALGTRALPRSWLARAVHGVQKRRVGEPPTD